MQNPMAYDVLYHAHQRRVGWVNDHGWQFAKPRGQQRVRQAVARALMAMAKLLTPAEAPGEAQTA